MKQLNLSKKRFSQFFSFFSKKSSSKLTQLLQHSDILSVILLRVDPGIIFKCILVCKEWMELITSSYFQREYLEHWNGNSKLVIGFMLIEMDSFRLVGTNNLGSYVNKMKILRGHCKFLSKSNSGVGLMLCTDPEDNLYVFNLATSRRGVIVTPLPPPPESFLFRRLHIMSCEDGSFKVVMVDFRDDISIQIFRSSVWRWEKSELSVKGYTVQNCKFVSRRDVVYFPARNYNSHQKFALLAYDTDNQHTCLIVGPSISMIIKEFYDITPEGNLRCVTIGYDRITVWDLKDEEDCEWKPSSNFNSQSLWEMNSTLALKGEKRIELFTFASFVPGRSDSIFVALGKTIFICNAHTKLLDKFEGEYYVKKERTGLDELIPLTLTESGVWPSSPIHKSS